MCYKGISKWCAVIWQSDHNRRADGHQGDFKLKEGEGYHWTSCLFWSLLLFNTLKDVGGCDVRSSSLFVIMDALSIWSVIRLPNLQIFIQCKNTGSTIMLQEWTARDWRHWTWIYLSVAKLELITALQSQRWHPVVFDEMSKTRYYMKKRQLKLIWEGRLGEYLPYNHKRLWAIKNDW